MFCLMVGDNILDIGCASRISMALTKLFRPDINIVGFEGNNVSQ